MSLFESTEEKLLKDIIKITLLVVIGTFGLLSIGSRLAYSVAPEQNIKASNNKINNIISEHKLAVGGPNIKMIIRGNAVFLEGHVTSKAEQIKVEHMAREMTGDKRLYNKITY